MRHIDNIINEAINSVVNEKKIIAEGTIDDIKQLLSDYRNKPNKSKEDIDKEKSLRRRLKDKRKQTRRLRKTKNGGKEYYDYNEYERSHKKTSKSDADAIRDTVDMENTDIAAVARSVFPSHTEEGAQSQLRKILTGERPMTSDVASKLQKMISNGKIAVK